MNMKLALFALTLAPFALPAFAEEGHSLLLRSKAAIASAAPHNSAPYAQPIGEPQREPIISPRDLRENESRSSCESNRDLCYDQSTGRIVYKPARNFMPDLPGFQADSISLKRDKIVFKYTF